MNRTREISLLVLATVLLLLSCMSCYVPGAVWNMSVLPELLLKYGTSPNPVTIVAFVVLFILLAIVLIPKSTGLKSPRIAIAISLVLLASITGLSALVLNTLFGSTILSSAESVDTEYYLIEHNLLTSYRYDLYRCDVPHLTCHSIPFSIPEHTGAPDILRIDAATRVLQVLDSKEQVVHEYQLLD